MNIIPLIFLELSLAELSSVELKLTLNRAEIRTERFKLISLVN
jgi:hypothetical protein